MTKKLIPRKVLFGNPDIGNLSISPDGKYVAYLAEHRGVLNIWVHEFDKPDLKRPVTDDETRGIFEFYWTYLPGVIVFPQDKGGDENYGLYTLDINTKENTEITKPGKTQTSIVKLSHLLPNQIILMINERDPKYFDYYVLDLVTKEQTELFINIDNYSEVNFDKKFMPVLSTKANPDGSSNVFIWNQDKTSFEQKYYIPFEDNMTSSFPACSNDGDLLYMIDSIDRDMAVLKEIDLKNNQEKVLAKSKLADIQQVRLHPLTGKPMFALSNYLEREFHILDAELEEHFDFLKRKFGTEFFVLTMSLAGDQWVLMIYSSSELPSFFFYDLSSKKLSDPILEHNNLLPYKESFHAMESIEIPARDGLKLVSYLTKTKKSNAGAMVLLVHGGPWGRDISGFDVSHQWLADRGYNVLSVNFRGSVGFGKSFINAGDLQWGCTMHDDLVDAVNWAISNGHASSDKVAIMGGSYGGYAALAGLTFTPKLFAAAVDIVGPSNLKTLLDSTPDYWESFKATLYRRVGDPRTKEGLELLKERSPLTHVHLIEKPLLILQGANDPRVKQAEADQIFYAMKEKKIPVEYVLFPDEGHGFRKAQNNIASNAVIEEFLQKHLGGEFENRGDDVSNSTAQFII